MIQSEYFHPQLQHNAGSTAVCRRLMEAVSEKKMSMGISGCKYPKYYISYWGWTGGPWAGVGSPETGRMLCRRAI